MSGGCRARTRRARLDANPPEPARRPLPCQVVPEYVHPVDEEGVCAGAFDLIFAFDEVISMGHKENITVVQASARLDRSRKAGQAPRGSV